jgi:hypothetical protein
MWLPVYGCILLRFILFVTILNVTVRIRIAFIVTFVITVLFTNIMRLWVPGEWWSHWLFLMVCKANHCARSKLHKLLVRTWASSVECWCSWQQRRLRKGPICRSVAGLSVNKITSCMQGYEVQKNYITWRIRLLSSFVCVVYFTALSATHIIWRQIVWW